MKNTQKGFIVPLLIAIIAVLAMGSGIYLYTQNKSQPLTQQQVTNNQTVSTSTNQNGATANKSSLVSNNSKNTQSLSTQTTDCSPAIYFYGNTPKYSSVDGDILKTNGTWKGKFVNYVSDSQRGSVPELQSGGGDAYLFQDITIPKDNSPISLTFDYYVKTTGTYLTFSFGDKVLFLTDLYEGEKGKWTTANNIPIDDLAGKTEQFLFTLHKTDGAEGTVLIDNVVFHHLLPPCQKPILPFNKMIGKGDGPANYVAPAVDSQISNWRTYADAKYNYQIQFPSSFYFPTVGFNIIYPKAYYEETNVYQPSMDIHVRSTNENSCYTEASPGVSYDGVGISEGKPAIVTMNGITFHAANLIISDGPDYGKESYLNTFHNGQCYSIFVTVRIFDQNFYANKSPGGGKLASYNEDLQIFPMFSEVVSMFKFTK